MSARSASRNWRGTALAAAGAMELLFLSSRFIFHFNFPAIHEPISFTLLLLLIATLALSFFHLPWAFAVLLITAFVPCNLDASRAHFLPVSPIDYVCFAALMACLWRIQPGKLGHELKRAFGRPALICWSLFIIYSFVCVRFIGGNARNTIRWMEFLFVFFLASLVPEEERVQTRAFLAQLLSVLGGLCALWGITQYMRAHFDFMAVRGPFGWHNALAAFLSLCFPASLWAALFTKMRRLFSLLSFIIFLGLLAAFSRGALLSLFAAFSVAALWARPDRRFRNLLYVAAGLLVLIGCLSVFHRLIWLNGRTMYWTAGLDMLGHHPLTGVGPGNYSATFPAYLKGRSLDILKDDLLNKQRNDFWQNLHNLYLQMAVEYGLIGFLLWFSGLFFLCRSIFSEENQIQDKSYNLQFYFLVSISAYLLHNLSDILFTNNLETIFAFLLALSRSESKNASP